MLVNHRNEYTMTDTADSNNLVSIRGTKCYFHKWEVASPKALVVVFHGIGAHGAYPTVRYAAEFLSEAGYTVVAFDFPGHGRSEGLKGYLKSADDLVENGVAMVDHARSLYPDLPLVLCGSSMGGAICLLVSDKLRQRTGNNDGMPSVILLAPMLKLNVSSLERTGLQALNYLVPTSQLIPRKKASGQYRDEEKRKECDNDSFSSPPGTAMRVGTALTCVDTALNVAEAFASIENPYLLLIADEDTVVDSEGSEIFHRTSASQDKTKYNYPALHGLLCEPSPLYEKIKTDILDWLAKRV